MVEFRASFPVPAPPTPFSLLFLPLLHDPLPTLLCLVAAAAPAFGWGGPSMSPPGMGRGFRDPSSMDPSPPSRSESLQVSSAGGQGWTTLESPFFHSNPTFPTPLLPIHVPTCPHPWPCSLPEQSGAGRGPSDTLSPQGPLGAVWGGPGDSPVPAGSPAAVVPRSHCCHQQSWTPPETTSSSGLCTAASWERDSASR